MHVNFPCVSHIYLTIAMLGLESWWIVEAERCMMFVLCVWSIDLMVFSKWWIPMRLCILGSIWVLGHESHVE